MVEINATKIYNELNINLASVLCVSGQANETTVVEHFIDSAVNDIKQLIAQNAYYGIATAEAYFADDVFENVLTDAILAQIDYVVKNGDARDLGGIMLKSLGEIKLSQSERVAAAYSPKAKYILLNAGLLYGGRL